MCIRRGVATLVGAGLAVIFGYPTPASLAQPRERDLAAHPPRVKTVSIRLLAPPAHEHTS